MEQLSGSALLQQYIIMQNWRKWFRNAPCKRKRRKIMKTRFDGYPHVICSQQFSRAWLETEFLPMADQMEQIVLNNGCNLLQGRRMVSLFYQPSTRTRMSFEFAMRYLGGEVAFSSENAREFSSGKKGETLRDTIVVVNCYRPDVIVLRYDQEIGAKFAAEVSSIPIINAGDRAPETGNMGDMGQHPTQALLDLRTIFKHRGNIDGLKIAMVGDLDKGRTVRSLSYLLGKFKGVHIYFVSPPNTQMGDDVKTYLIKHEVSFSEHIDLREIAPEVDALYQTRTQVECGTLMDKSRGFFDVDMSIANAMRDDSIIMHPLPRVDEISTEVDDNHRAVYRTKQVASGLYTRMALLKMILAPNF